MPKERVYRKEEDVKKRVKQILQARGWSYRMPAANMFGTAGLSDFICWKAGMFMGIEAKYKNNAPTGPQCKFLKDLIDENCFGFVVNEKTVEALDEFLGALWISVECTIKRQKVPDDIGALMINCIGTMQQPIWDVLKLGAAPAQGTA